MSLASLQVVPFASPAPFLVPRHIPERPEATRPKKRTKKKVVHVDQDTIAPVPLPAKTALHHGDDADDISLAEIDDDEIERQKNALAQRNDLTAGVEKIENVTRLWTPTSVVVAWTGMMLLAIALSLDSLTVSSYQPYALSEFKSHSMLPAIVTIQNILNAATKPVMAKVADAFGRSEAFSASLLAIVLGFVINATSRNLGTMAAGQIFYSMGQVGIMFLQQILAADTTTLINRSIFGSLLYSPPIFTAWIGGPVVESLVPAHWRWGYGMWAIIVPVVSIPLLVSLWWHQRTAQKIFGRGSNRGILTTLSQSDFPGLLLFIAGLVLVLLPMTLTVRFQNGWTSPQILVMIILGVLCFTGFILYELYIARYPILSIRLARSRTVAAGCLTEALFFLSYYIWQPYFYSFLVVVNDMSPKTATNMVTAQGVATAVVGLAAAFVVKYTGSCKWMIVSGTLVKLIGGGLMIRYSNPDATVVQVLFGQIISGGGSGMISIVAQTAVQAAAQHQDVANATTLYEAARAIGGAIGNAISGSIWTHLLLSRLQTHLPEASRSKAAAIQNSFTFATSFAVGSKERTAINQSYTEVMHILLVIAIFFLAASFMASLAIEDVDLKAIDEGNVQTGVIGRINFRRWLGRFSPCDTRHTERGTG